MSPPGRVYFCAWARYEAVVAPEGTTLAGLFNECFSGARSWFGSVVTHRDGQAEDGRVLVVLREELSRKALLQMLQLGLGAAHPAEVQVRTVEETTWEWRYEKEAAIASAGGVPVGKAPLCGPRPQLRSIEVGRVGQ